jgi:hypothetical protein
VPAAVGSRSIADKNECGRATSAKTPLASSIRAASSGKRGTATRPTDGEPQSVELLFWESIKGSTRIADYEAYLRQYPEGSFVALARTRLGEFASAAGGMRDPNDREVEL